MELPILPPPRVIPPDIVDIFNQMRQQQQQQQPRILQVSTGLKLTIQRAIERGIKSNPNGFQIPYNNVIIKINDTYRIATPQEATQLVKNKTIRL